MFNFFRKVLLKQSKQKLSVSSVISARSEEFNGLKPNGLHRDCLIRRWTADAA